jgi:hypothetical protein
MAKDGNGGLKILKGLERLVHAREAEIGDFVQLLQRAKDGEAHFMGVDFRSAGRADRFLDLLRQHGKVVFGHGPALACFPHPVDHFAAAERFADAGALDHREAGGFHCREAAAAFRTLTTAADRGAVIGHPAVHHAGIRVAAKRAIHVASFPGRKTFWPEYSSTSVYDYM